MTHIRCAYQFFIRVSWKILNQLRGTKSCSKSMWMRYLSRDRICIFLLDDPELSIFIFGSFSVLNERSRDVSSKCPIFYIRKTCNAPFTHLILKRRWWSILKISNHSKSGAFGVKSTFLVFDTKQRPKMKSIDFGPFGRKI